MVTLMKQVCILQLKSHQLMLNRDRFMYFICKNWILLLTDNGIRWFRSEISISSFLFDTGYSVTKFRRPRTVGKKWMEIWESKIYLKFKIYYNLYLVEKNTLLEVIWITVEEIYLYCMFVKRLWLVLETYMQNFVGKLNFLMLLGQKVLFSILHQCK